ncbi:hypothetical protein EVAR_37464_1 [Eumeta japonica]|uniref:Uncharacterized protein n=1 Tax=Eumeta variegata TaxID=151549 RepID=A0A4C1XDM2_EUMVA|nr:hypothetical protein EVAR_37464_1 [Eumeta japonica]
MIALVKTLLVLQCCGLCLNIRVPLVWDDNSNSDSKESEVKTEASLQPDTKERNKQFAIETFEPYSIDVKSVQNPTPIANAKPIPIEYFEYPAIKPQFAINVASFHGVKAPQNHYRASPVLPYTDVKKPILGKHRIKDESKSTFEPIQDFIPKNEGLNRYLRPVLSNYEVFHPYKAETPALTQLYKDPILQKIRDDIRENGQKSQKYQKEVENAKITTDENLKSPNDIDKEKVPQRNIPARYEIHNHQRRPVYYNNPVKINREKYFTKKFRHPWNQNFAKIMPAHYRPLQHHLQQLRQHHAQKYDDERNEYPQINHNSNYEEPSDGYDIYQKGKEKYVALRNNVDNAINEAAKESHPSTYQKLELQPQDNDSDDNEEEFVPIKNYAQVRKTETTKHLPKEAAIHEATSFDELQNAPRLREAIKSTKAQTIYTEEGYEDSAYDHAGEQKHASEQEGHGGYLKEKENSKGKYKIPSWSASFEDGKGSDYGEKVEDGKKWKNVNKDTEEAERSEDFNEQNEEQLKSVNNYDDKPESSREENESVETEREKRHDLNNSNTNEHDVNKREVDFQVPLINLNNTYLTESEILNIAKEKIVAPKINTEYKYPYYSKNTKKLNKNSPLRYAENLNLIPKKSKGGTEFYDSRSTLECPEVDTEVNPIPEKIQNDSVKNESVKETDEDETENFEDREKREVNQEQEKPRLKGLGDKIDCFKNKYFGENPLDSPFFNEEIINQPDPIIIPSLPSLKLVDKLEISAQDSKSNNVFKISEKLRKEKDIFELLDKLRKDQQNFQEQVQDSNEKPKSSLHNNSSLNKNILSDQSNVYTDVIQNIRSTLKNSNSNYQNAERVTSNLLNVPIENKEKETFNSFKNKEHVIKIPSIIRKKRASFVYEPYKVIRDNAASDSKKTTTTSNISPLIKQLQSSRLVDSNASKEEKKRSKTAQPTKRDVTAKNYKDISKEDRKKRTQPVSTTENPRFVDVSTDDRRGEPRYELAHSNHKTRYTPVKNQKSISLDDYKFHQKQSSQDMDDDKRANDDSNDETKEIKNKITTTIRPYFDVSMYLPRSVDVQNQAASKNIHKRVKTTTPATEGDSKRKVFIQSKSKQTKIDPEENDEDEYDDYDDDEIDTTTTSTVRSVPKSRSRRVSTTTPIPSENDDSIVSHEIEKNVSTRRPKLKLVTRFHQSSDGEDNTPESEMYKDTQNRNVPKFSEKSKKSSKSTLVTDSKTYGEGNDDMRKEEIDALIGVSQNDEYMPSYEIESKNKQSSKIKKDESDEEDTDYDIDKNEKVNEEIDEEEEDDDDEDEEQDDDDDYESNSEETKERDLEEQDKNEEQDTLVHTTEKTNEKYIEMKPIVLKKKVEIHKELPVNKTLPHYTQFKEDIKEEEIIKKMPQKNLEALELYKDENLATNVNKLADVEVLRKTLIFERSQTWRQLQECTSNRQR